MRQVVEGRDEGVKGGNCAVDECFGDCDKLWY